MLAVIQQALTLPTPQDNAEFNIQAHMLRTMIAVLWLANAVTLIVSLFLLPEQLLLVVFLSIYLACTTISFILLKRGQTAQAAKLVALALWTLGVLSVFNWRSITPATTIVFAVAMIAAALLLSKPLSITLSLLNVAVCTVVFAATQLGWWPPVSQSFETFEYTILAAGLLLITIVLANARKSLAQIVGQSRALADERGVLIAQLQNEIDERKRAEAALRASQDILKQAKQIAKLGSFSMDRDAATLAFSEHAYAILGLEPDTPITSEMCLSRFGIDLVDRLKQGLEAVAATNRPFDFDHDITMPDGNPKTLHFTARPVEGDDHFFGIVQDITDRMIAEKDMQRLTDEITATIRELENEQSLLRAVLNAIPVRVFWKDLDLRYLGCNQLLADDVGLASWQDVVGKNDFELPWAARAEKHRADDRAIIESGRPRLNTEEPARVQSWVRSSKVPLRDKNGTIIGVLGTYEDISEQKRMEQALRESEAALKMAQEIAKMGSFEFNTVTNFIQFSDELYRIFELEPGSEVSVESLTKLIGEADYPRLLEYAYDAAETGESYEVEYEMEFSSGAKKYLYAHSRPLEDIQGNRTRVLGIVQDITERKKIEVERERLAAIVSNSADFIGMADHDGNTIYVNPGGLRALQYESTDNFAQPSIRMFHDDATADLLFSKAIPATLSSGRWRGETRLKRKDGTLFDVDQTIFVMRDAAGETYGIATICRDITEQKRAEQALRESEARYASLVNRAYDGVIVIQDERMVFLNRAMAALLGGTVEELQNQAYVDFVAPESRDLVLGRVTARLAGEDVPALYEAKLQRKDGTVFDAELSAAMVMQDGKPSSMGIVRDISERKRAEQALRESEVRYSSLVNRARDGVLVAQDDRIIFLNNAMADLLGGTVEELQDQGYADFVAPESRDLVLGRVAARLAGEDVPSLYEAKLQRKDGTIFDAELSAAVVMQDGKPASMGIIRDISERKRAQDALRESEARFRALFEQLPLGAFLTTAGPGSSRATIIADCNEVAARMNGYTREELIGQQIDIVLANSASYDEEARLKVWQMMREQGAMTSEVEYVRKDGSIYPVQATGAILTIQGEEMLLVVERDITEAKRAEQALRESEMRFRGLFEQLPLGAFLTAARAEGTRAAVIIDCNDAAARMNGYSRDELIGQKIDVLLAENSQVDEKTRREFWDYVREQGFVTIETDHIRKDGTTYPTQTTVSMLELQGEEVLLSVERDITGAKRAEQALRESETRYRRLAEDTPALVCKFEADSTLTYVNSTYAAYFGGTPETLVGQRFLDFLPDDDQRENTKSQYLNLNCDNPTITYEEHIAAPDGSPRWQQWTDRALCDPDGSVIGYQSIGVDVTDRKRAESERERLIEELEAKNAELERFTYTVSHDLKSPLITIRGFLGYLEGDARQGNFSRMSADIERIGNATVKMERLLNELLELSRVGRKNNPPEAILFEHVVHEAMEMAQGRLQAGSVRVEIMPDAPPLYGDRVRLIEVMQNLIDNAAKFLGDQPDPCIEVGARVEDAQTLVYVKDNGIGIDAEYHEKVFGLFDKLDVNSEGTGVGLALVKRIIEVHGGKIWVESAGKGQGTTFWFTLPNAPA